jgi:hypothetical protein
MLVAGNQIVTYGFISANSEEKRLKPAAPILALLQSSGKTKMTDEKSDLKHEK